MMWMVLLLIGASFAASACVGWILRGLTLYSPWEEAAAYRMAAIFGASALAQIGLLLAIAARALL
jgi:hypothetical protein